MAYDFDTVLCRTGTDSVKYSPSIARRMQPLLPDDFIPLWIADMDFACPPEVLAAMHARLDRGILGYSAVEMPEYGALVSGWMRRRFGWDPDPGSLVLSAGVVQALETLVSLLAKPGEGVILQPPVYGPFLRSILRAGCRPVESPLRDEGGGRYAMDFDDLERKAADPSTTLLLLCSPHNPVGRVWREEELRRMARICFDHGVRIVSDEIHADLTRLGVRHVPLASLFPDDPRIATCTAPSKTFNLAGNALAHVHLPDSDARAAWECDHAHHPNPLSIAAVRAAYAQGDAWLDELRAYLDGNLARIGTVLAERLPRAVYRVPEGTYLAWIGFPGTGLAGPELLAVAARDAGLLLDCGERYVSHGEGWLRLNAACPRSLLDAALDRFCRAFAPYAGG